MSYSARTVFLGMLFGWYSRCKKTILEAFLVLVIVGLTCVTFGVSKGVSVGICSTGGGKVMGLRRRWHSKKIEFFLPRYGKSIILIKIVFLH